ncbi:hypothetical protein FRD01_11860 [Microvenator marinus]|uniref:Uncharacterized protein n=1 Tax=Microvenator marinus TaxID=2600177 RepID=A0A5B8XWR7_9DELT|nr:hypothetical protein [Microvenator marinus]QED27919.1 hypothetical protein FRD01_11860 [Microvenator marinus]
MTFAAESEAVCTAALNAGYDDCVTFQLTDAPQFSATTICDYREIGMTSSWDATAQLLTITIDPNNGDGIPAVRHPVNDGNWSSLSDYKDAFYGLAFGEGCNDDIDIPRPDQCGDLNIKYVISDRPYWIDSGGISPYQNLDPFWGALASDDGVINIEDTGIFDLIGGTMSSCDTQSASANGDTFEVQQCSYYEVTDEITVFEPVCERKQPHFIRSEHASTRFEYFKWNSLQTTFLFDPTPGNFSRLAIKADARLENDYFDSNSSYVDGDVEVKLNTVPFSVGRDNRDGVCGASKVSKNMIFLQPKTYVGYAPNCFQ